MNEIITLEKENIESKIYEIRGVQVMLSADIAKLYNVETKVLNQTIKRNINRFPESFCFQLTEDELKVLRSQIVTSSLIDGNKVSSICFNGARDNDVIWTFEKRYCS